MSHSNQLLFTAVSQVFQLQSDPYSHKTTTTEEMDWSRFRIFVAFVYFVVYWKKLRRFYFSLSQVSRSKLHIYCSRILVQRLLVLTFLSTFTRLFSLTCNMLKKFSQRCPGASAPMPTFSPSVNNSIFLIDFTDMVWPSWKVA